MYNCNYNRKLVNSVFMSRTQNYKLLLFNNNLYLSNLITLLLCSLVLRLSHLVDCSLFFFSYCKSWKSKIKINNKIKIRKPKTKTHMLRYRTNQNAIAQPVDKNSRNMTLKGRKNILQIFLKGENFRAIFLGFGR